MIGAKIAHPILCITQKVGWAKIAHPQFRVKDFSQKYIFDQLMVGILNFDRYHRNQRDFAVILMYQT